MICQHLRNETGLGYAVVLAKPEDDDYETAMCEGCEKLLLSENGWTDQLSDVADWTLFCKQCCQNVLRRHRLVAEGYMT
jgi:hypothetical protein